MYCIPAYQSTIALLQRLKPKSKNWDDFLLSAFEDFLPPETVGELGRREKTEKSSTFAEVEKRHPGWGRRHGPVPDSPLAAWKEKFSFTKSAEGEIDRPSRSAGFLPKVISRVPSTSLESDSDLGCGHASEHTGPMAPESGRGVSGYLSLASGNS